jgi:hypothetical protein
VQGLEFKLQYHQKKKGRLVLGRRDGRRKGREWRGEKGREGKGKEEGRNKVRKDRKR